MTKTITVTAAHDRRRAGLSFKKGQATPVELPDDEEKRQALFDALNADPVLNVDATSAGSDEATSGDKPEPKPKRNQKPAAKNGE